MTTQPWYIEFFLDDYQRTSRHNLTPERTAAEVEFAQKALTLPPGSRILDLCCGWDRHAIALARRGHQVVGLDLSPTHIEEARASAKA